MLACKTQEQPFLTYYSLDLGQEDSRPSTSADNRAGTSGGSSRTTRTWDNREFQFKIRWTDLPSETRNKLKEANDKGEEADSSDVKAIKLAIAKKLESSYIAYRQANPGSQLTPGRKIYQDVTDQVRYLKIFVY